MTAYRLAVFGGSFDPPHVGHVLVAEKARARLGLDEVRWIPNVISPLKTGSDPAPAHHRMEMARLAAMGRPCFTVSEAEIKRGGVSFTLDTLRAIRAERPEAELFLLLGEDTLESFDAWREPDKVRSLVRLIVYPRGASEEGRKKMGPEDVLLEGARMDVSSTEIRRRLEGGQVVDDLLPESVLAYILSNGLYGTGRQEHPSPRPG